ncbi:MAG: metal ABC transporter permease [Armatimonadetes bacterium]|nr:metal ABC transporter permease [Armatimonadota bacterium]
MSAIIEQLHYGFFQRALVACLMVGTVCALLSAYVVLRRLVFTTVALTQLSSAGLGVSALAQGLAVRAGLLGLLAPYLAPVPTSLAMTLVGVGILALVQPGRRSRTDNLVALLYVGGWAASILLYAVAERGDTEMAAILYGDILGVMGRDLLYFAPVAAIVALLVLWLGKELLFTSFDPETAVTYRLPVWIYDVLFLSLLALVIVFAVKMLGLMLVFGYLVAPGTAALLVCRRMPPALAVAVVFAAAMSLFGLGVAAAWDLPPGPAVTAAGVALLLGIGLVRTVGAWVFRPAGRALPGLQGETARVALLTAALLVATVVAAGLASHIGEARTADHLEGHAPAGSPDHHAPEVQYAPHVEDELPDPEALLGGTGAATGSPPPAPRPSSGATRSGPAPPEPGAPPPLPGRRPPP